MRRAFHLPLCLASVAVWSCAPEPSSKPTPRAEPPLGKAQSRLGGIEGTFEAALDAPWRIEPVIDRAGRPSYSAIPIQLSIHDANLAALDKGVPAFLPPNLLPELDNPRIGRFCEIVIEEDVGGTRVRTHKSMSGLTEIESTLGSWLPAGAPPPHTVCKPSAGPCDDFIGPTSEWHAGTWYTPVGGITPGQDLPLVLSARVTRDPGTSCVDPDSSKYLRITNHVRVHFGEAPLPRFDNQWVYGDIHYHAQGTDNEGEAGYHYRGVMRAIGAMGVDFALASDHASASEQVVDADIDIDPFSVEIDLTRGVLRDMNARRWAELHGVIWNPGGVSAEALQGPNGSFPQGYLSHGVVPRVFLGGEVDAIPEIDKGWDGKGYAFGNGLRFELNSLCGGWFYSWITIDGDCDPSKLRHDASDAILFRDVQGIHDYDFARSHLVYLPRTSTSATAFVGSFTGKFGGGSRRLTEPFEGRDPLLPEINRKGYAFLAHPVPGGSCPSKPHGDPFPNGAQLMSNPEGGEGPDIPPYTPLMLTHAFQSPAVLGLQFWNEDTRLCTRIGNGDAKEIGFDTFGDYPMKNYGRFGFQTGEFELAPWFAADTGQYQDWSMSVEWMLHHGARQWDDMLLRGIDPIEAASVGWVAPGDPRRMYIAGGSDAHGDFNYRREGYVSGTSMITDTALAKVRNLVFAGAPTEWKDKFPIPAHSQEQVFAAMREGNFSVTDGPALRIVIDRNGNGVIDPTDIPMGGIVDLNGASTLPLLVEWKSTPEFGALSDVQLYVGVQAGDGIDNRTGAVYAVKAHGPRADGIASSSVLSSYDSNGYSYELMEDRYTIDPTGLLSVSTGGALSGVRAIQLPIAAFEAGVKGARPQRLWVRAFADTVMKDQAGCINDEKARRLGACIRRYAFTNPVWAVPGSNKCDKAGPRDLDRDGDGIPDGCDPCPTDRSNSCKPPIFTRPDVLTRR